MEGSEAMNFELKRKLQFQATKYLDILTILQKLENEGYLNKIIDLLSRLCQEEHEFTLGELRKIGEKAREDDFFDIREQFFNNTSIFKRNLLLIFQILVDDVWKIYDRRFEEKIDALEASAANDSRGRIDEKRIPLSELQDTRPFSNKQTSLQSGDTSSWKVPSADTIRRAHEAPNLKDLAKTLYNQQILLEAKAPTGSSRLSGGGSKNGPGMLVNAFNTGNHNTSRDSNSPSHQRNENVNIGNGTRVATKPTGKQHQPSEVPSNGKLFKYSPDRHDERRKPSKSTFRIGNK
eukprot:TRINITY_DN1438_c0_g4_i3.p1 TRINITY_DN1438_c0_g4~~TRINITY_DN1438_c0_g4_i3.p1  ORF type:complete len:292 (-),score=78.91 TRINITY_DN1438_c0_g4_i3:50-925(-)